MEATEKLALVKVFLGPNDETPDATITAYINLAEQRIFDRLWPFGIPDDASVPSRYEGLQCELASRMIQRRGIEGQLLDIEGDIHRHYASADDDDIIKRITPFAKVM